MTIDDYRNERLRKLAEIKNLGIDPYPAKSFRTHKIGDIIANFGKLENQTVTLAGRISAIRSFGKLAFVKIKDMSGEIQIFMKDVANLPSETVSRNSHENFEVSETRNGGLERTGLNEIDGEAPVPVISLPLNATKTTWKVEKVEIGRAHV